MTTSRILRAIAALAFAALGLYPTPATAAESSVETGNTAEAWYRDPVGAIPDGAPDPGTPDLCTLPILCPDSPSLPVPVQPPSPGGASYPEGTLHVEATAGRTTAHTYVVPDLSVIPDGATVLKAFLTLPVTKGPEAGNLAVDTARIQACLTTEEVRDEVAGAVAGAPDFDCEAVTAKVRYQQEIDAFTLDLIPFLEAWASGTENFGVTLVAALDLGVNAEWHVSVNGDDAPLGKTASTRIVFEAPPPEEEPDVPEETTEPTIAPPGGDGGAQSGGGGGFSVSEPPTSNTAPIDPTAPTAQTAPTAETPVATALAPAPYALINSPWYTYRGVVFLPLAFLLALSLTGRSLTRPLYQWAPTTDRTRRSRT